MARSFTLALAHASLLHVSPPNLVRIAAASGFGAVSLRLIPIDRPGEPRWTPDEHPRLIEDTRRALDETGLEVIDVEVLQIRDDRDVRAHLPALERAAVLGARHVLANIYTPNASVADEQFASLCDIAKPLGLLVALEFVSFSNATTLAHARDVVRRSGRGNARVLVDVLHFTASRASLDDLTSLAPVLVRYAHLCDVKGPLPASPDELRHITREARMFPGEGDIDVGGILRRLPRDICYAVEAQNPTRAKALGAETYAKLAYDTTMAYLETRLGDRPATTY